MKEADIQRGIMNFLRMIGCAVYSTSQGFRRDPGGTRMTPGLPDLLVFNGPQAWTFAEIKTEKGKLSPAQHEFADHALACDVPWECWRSVEDAKRWAVAVGIVEEA